MLLSVAYEVTNYTVFGKLRMSGYFESREKAEEVAENINRMHRRGLCAHTSEVIPRYNLIMRHECEEV